MATRGDEFGELSEFLDDSITLPVPGKDGTKDYVIPSVDGKTGLWAQHLLEEVERAREDGNPDAGKLDDGDERLLYERMLGPVLGTMLDDGVRWQTISHAAMTVFFWTTAGRDAAIKYWKAGGSPERLRSAGSPNRASRRASAAAANTTRKQGSTSGTRASKGKAKKNRR